MTAAEPRRGTVVGVECKAGWVTAALEMATGRIVYSVLSIFQDVLRGFADARCIAVDIPIGLPSDGSRRCELEARKLLPGRASSVFPAPLRPFLQGASQAEAVTMAKAAGSKSISIQAFSIIPKIRDVDRKKTPEGFEERRAILVRALPTATIPERARARAVAPGAAPDDLLDATVAAWTAQRVARGEEQVLRRSGEQRDARGLRVEMVF